MHQGGSVKKQNTENGVANTKRRTFIKFALLGVGAFTLGKFLDPMTSFFKTSTDKKTYLFENFRVVEDEDELGFYDREGNQIMALEKSTTE